MQVRFSTWKGALVVEESSEEVLGNLVDVLVHPDTGSIEGFSVHVCGGHHQGILFCQASDVLRFGTRLYVRSADVLCDPSEIVRLHALLEDGRRVLGQRVRTESGGCIGRCKDVQFNTGTMHLEWIFPKKLFWWKRAIAAADILEVTQESIVVRDVLRAETEEERESATVFDPIEAIEPKASRVVLEEGEGSK